jgi:hypothetical protein
MNSKEENFTDIYTLDLIQFQWDVLDISGEIPRNMTCAYSINLEDEMIVLFWNCNEKMKISLLGFNNFQ